MGMIPAIRGSLLKLQAASVDLTTDRHTYLEYIIYIYFVVIYIYINILYILSYINIYIYCIIFDTVI